MQLGNAPAMCFPRVSPALWSTYSLIFLCGSVSSRAKGPKGTAGGCLQTLHPVSLPQPPSLRARVAGTPSQNVLRAPLCACKARGWAAMLELEAGAEFLSMLRCMERLQALSMGSARARLCSCPGKSCGISRSCVCVQNQAWHGESRQARGAGGAV